MEKSRSDYLYYNFSVCLTKFRIFTIFVYIKDLENEKEQKQKTKESSPNTLGGIP